MKITTLITLTLLFHLVSCVEIEDISRTIIPSGQDSFVCVKENRTLEYTVNSDPTIKTLIYGTCEEYKNQDENSFDSFRSNLCDGGVAYMNTNCKSG